MLPSSWQNTQQTGRYTLLGDAADAAANEGSFEDGDNDGCDPGSHKCSGYVTIFLLVLVLVLVVLVVVVVLVLLRLLLAACLVLALLFFFTGLSLSSSGSLGVAGVLLMFVARHDMIDRSKDLVGETPAAAPPPPPPEAPPLAAAAAAAACWGWGLPLLGGWLAVPVAVEVPVPSWSLVRYRHSTT
jgi:hypothetical protein